jgi:hypothetical protein
MISRKWLYFILFVLLIWFSSKINWEYSPNYSPATLFTVQQLQDDLQILRKKIQKQHPALRYYNYDNAFESLADSLNQSFSDLMTVKDFYFQISPLIEKINCGHTKLYLPDYYWFREDSSLNILPVRFYFQDNRIWCRQNDSKNKRLQSGMEVLKINHLTSTQIIENFKRRISSDGFNETYKYAQMNRLAYGLFPGYPDFPDEYSIICKKPGSLKQLEIHLKAQPIVGDSDLLPTSEALSDYPFQFKVIDSLNTGVVRVGVFITDHDLNYDGFIHRSFQQISNLNLSHLILDVRNNDGGDPSHAVLLLTYLLNEPFIYFKKDVYGYNHLKKPIEPAPNSFSGQLYVLIDGGCFSTTGHFLSLLREYDRGILIGEDTGGSFLCFGCPDELVLPETKLKLTYMRCTFSTHISYGNLGQGVRPDYFVKPKISDIITGKDTILSAALTMIEQEFLK